MPDFPINLGSPSSHVDVLDYIESYCPYPVKWRLWWRQIIYLDAARRVFTPAAATTQTLTLNTLFPNNSFPANVDVLRGAKLRRIVDGAGGTISALTAQFGGTFTAGADPNGLLEASNIFTGAGAGYSETPAAAHFAGEYVANLNPTVLLTSTTGDLDELEEGAFEVMIPWAPLRRYS